MPGTLQHRKVPGSFFVGMGGKSLFGAARLAGQLQMDELRVSDGDQDRDNFRVRVDFLQGRLIGLHLAGVAIDEVVR